LLLEQRYIGRDILIAWGTVTFGAWHAKATLPRVVHVVAMCLDLCVNMAHKTNGEYPFDMWSDLLRVLYCLVIVDHNALNGCRVYATIPVSHVSVFTDCMHQLGWYDRVVELPIDTTCQNLFTDAL
jgi:hypothetical protein